VIGNPKFPAEPSALDTRPNRLRRDVEIEQLCHADDAVLRGGEVGGLP
jgi:hypothetical protein